MGNQKSSNEKLCKNETEPNKKTKKSHSLNTLLNANFSLIRSVPNKKIRIKFNKRSKQKVKNSKKQTCTTEYTSLNDYNTKNLKSNSFQDNYFSIYDECPIEKKSKTLQPTYDNNLYSKIISNSNSRSGFFLAYNLQPLNKFLNKLSAFSRKTNKYPCKMFDPNEEFYLNLPVPQKLSINNFHDQSNLYTDMSESICSDISRIKLDTEENYQSLHDQYDYISSSSRYMNLSMEPPPLPPASTQPCRDHVINQMYTSVDPLSMNNQVYYSFSSDISDTRCDYEDENNNDASIVLSTSSSICTSERSSLSNENLIKNLKCTKESSNSDFRIVQI
ncbi:unnamed protein product [Brachionus calyciflorus]|uniref:Uncharacterized protein n=1 Tax=Brachionus calyciflorus TaxID=104777 RepID=A0A813SX97_9BILA|nr:unnamed protein product [Brachionus calyciflorus]